jgi:catechol 2,3-dioxygenase-like lactoylglutathione lyase family enzyme
MDWKIELIPVPVTDVDRAKRFYAEQVGFGVDFDTAAGEGMRLVQLTPAGSGCSIMLGTGVARSAPGSLQGVQIVVADIGAARKELVERGVGASTVHHYEQGNQRAEGPGGPWNSFVTFADPDGNGWVLQERPAD